MQRLQGYRLDGDLDQDHLERPSIYVFVDKTVVVRRESNSRDVDDFRVDLTIGEAHQLWVALGELLPKVQDGPQFP